MERWDQGTEYGEVALTVQKCKSAYGLCEGGKVKSEDRVQRTEYGRVAKTVQRCKSEQRPVEKWEGEVRLRSTDYGVRSAGGARERQRAPTGSDTFRMPNEVRPHGALGWHAVPTLPAAWDVATFGS